MDSQRACRRSIICLVALLAVSACTTPPEGLATSTVPSSTAETDVLPTIEASTDGANAPPTPEIPSQPVAVTLQPPLSDLAFNIFDYWQSFDAVCRGERIIGGPSHPYTPGQIWIANYPYEHSYHVLGHGEVGYYSPVWSTDREWLAAVRVDTSVAVESRLDAESGCTYDIRNGAISIQVVAADGAEQRQVGPSLMYTEERCRGVCTPLPELAAIDGISSDGMWLSFRTLGGSAGQPALGLANLVTGEIAFQSTEGAGTTVWGPSSSRLARYSIRTKTVEVMSVQAGEPSWVRYEIPREAGQSWVQVQWLRDESGLVLITSDNAMRAGQLWLLDFETQAWRQVTTVPARTRLTVPSRDNRVIVCETGESFDGVRAIDLATGTVVWSSPQVPEGSDVHCENGVIEDQAGNAFLTFSADDATGPSREVWIASLDDPSFRPQLIVRADDLGVPPGFRFLGIR